MLFSQQALDSVNSKGNSAINNNSIPSSLAVDDQRKPADGMMDTLQGIQIEPPHPAAQTVESVPETQDEQSSASDSAANAVAGPHTPDIKPISHPEDIVKPNTIPKSALLDILPDDDEIDDWQPINPWNSYFKSAQEEEKVEPEQKRQRASLDSRTPLAVDEILDKLKLNEKCNDAILRAKLRDLVEHYQDRFAVNVESKPAAISPFNIEVDESKWLQRKSVRISILDHIASHDSMW
jgi:hypothetical protein